MDQSRSYIHDMSNPNALLDRFVEQVCQCLTMVQAMQLADFGADDATQVH